jgi:hypothetical protein
MRIRLPFVLVFTGLAACASQPQTGSLAPSQGEPPGFAGLAASELKASFGEPSFVRRDGSAEIWRYDGQTCRAFFFLYPGGGGEVVRHVETLPRGTTIAADATCLDALRGRTKVS